MKRFFWVMTIFLSFNTVYAEDQSALIIYTYTPITRAINTIYEVDFYSDGLVKEIRKYLNPQDRTIPTSELNKLNDIRLLETISVSRSDSRISVYKKSKNATKELIEYYDYLNSGMIQRMKVNDLQTSRLIEIYDNYGSFNYNYKNELTFSFSNEKNKMTWEYPTHKSITSYLISDNASLEKIIIDEPKNISWINITHSKSNEYQIENRDDEFEPFISKYDIFNSGDYEISPMTVPINLFLCPNDTTNKITAFFIRNVFDRNRDVLRAGKTYESSSILVEGTINYKASNLGNSLFAKPWVEGVNGYGIGETITISDDREFTELILSNGYKSYDNPTLYEKNSRLKKIQIKGMDTETVLDVDIKDSSGPQSIKLPKSETKVVITILDIYPGSTWEDTCVNYILVR
ncbi:NADase-type glycan-binding domain-containing protein [Spirochaeta cellobiosiphila]|uniref:NADase-type glycan-binding domain-containing protein n=1 Tax=Spirochaeta cellobiosiphila TaxID=504483 RepID=UPI00041E2908|nr:hypothetical protein [Spirochaeta cellobiosiphila]